MSTHEDKLFEAPPMHEYGSLTPEHVSVFARALAGELGGHQEVPYSAGEYGSPEFAPELAALGNGENDRYAVSGHELPEQWETDTGRAWHELTGEVEWAGESSLPEAEFGRLVRRAVRMARQATPGVLAAASRLAPLVSGALGLPPGTLDASGLLQQALREAQPEVAALESSIFSPEFLGEVATESGQEAGLAEALAAEAAMASSEQEVQALIAATLPLAVRLVRVGRTTRPVLPALLTARRGLVRAILRRGSPARRVLTLLPTIDRLALRTYDRMVRHGAPATSRTAIAALATAARAVLGDPSTVRQALERNAVARARWAAPAPGMFTAPRRY